MTLEVGKKIRGREVVYVSPDKRVWATFMPDSLGAKGKIWGKMLVQNPTDEERREYWDNAIQIIEIDGVWYKVLEMPMEYADVFRRCNWYLENEASAYSRKGCF
jgi:hypothetical protein